MKAKLQRDKPWRRTRRRAGAVTACPCCKSSTTFLWSCPCGLSMCQPCMDENAWGVTCNGITWTCPDCGATRSY